MDIITGRAPLWHHRSRAIGQPQWGIPLGGPCLAVCKPGWQLIEKRGEMTAHVCRLFGLFSPSSRRRPMGWSPALWSWRGTGNFDTGFDHLSRISQRDHPIVPCDVPYFVPMLIGCCLVLAIRWCARFTPSGRPRVSSRSTAPTSTSGGSWRATTTSTKRTWTQPPWRVRSQVGSFDVVFGLFPARSSQSSMPSHILANAGHVLCSSCSTFPAC